MTSDPVKHILSQFGKRQMTTRQSLAERLEELSKKATPGPWKAAHSDPAEGVDVWWLCAGQGNAEKELGSLAGGYPHDKQEANAALITELRNNLPTILSALRSRDSVIEGAARDVVNSRFETYKARNGRVCSIEGDDGEKCWIVPFEAMASLESALSSHAETAGGWRPIETAPKDGTPILISIKGVTLPGAETDVIVRMARFRQGGAWVTDKDVYYKGHGVTHWMPLPPPPQSPTMIKAAKGGEM